MTLVVEAALRDGHPLATQGPRSCSFRRLISSGDFGDTFGGLIARAMGDGGHGAAFLIALGGAVMEESRVGPLVLPPEGRVLVLGPAPAGLVRVLWGAGLRPVRGRRVGMLWASPGEGGRR